MGSSKHTVLILLALVFCITVFPGATSMKTPDIRDARRHAEEVLLPLEGVVGVSHCEDPPRIVVYIEHERYRDRIPETTDGFKIEVVVIGRVRPSPYYSLRRGLERTTPTTSPLVEPVR